MREWRSEAEQDIRAVSTAIRVLEERNKKLSQTVESASGDDVPSDVQYSG